MKKSLIYIAAAALGATALSACDDDFAYPPVVEPESQWAGQANTTIAELKAAYWQDTNNYNTAVGLNEDGTEVIVKARVISSDASGNIYNNIVIEDETGAMTIASRTLNSSTKLASQFPFGAEVYLNLSGCYVGRYAGLFQMGQASGTEISFLENATLTEHMQANSLARPQLVDTMTVDIATLAAAKSNTEQLQYYMSRLVRLDNVTFQNAGQPFAATATENRYVTDAAGGRINVRCSNRSTWHNEMIPGGTGAVVGILSYFNNDWQVLMIDASGCIGFDPSWTPEPTPEVKPEGEGTQASPYNVAKALEVTNALPADQNSDKVYVKGKIASIDEIDTGSFGNATYNIVDEAGATAFKIFRGYYFNGDKFTAANQLEVGAEVIVYGALVNFKGNTPEMAQGNYVYSYNGQTSGGTTPTPDPTPVEGVVFSETFQSGNLGSFTVENKISNDFSGWYAKASGPACAMANSYVNNANLEAESWLISPEISLEGCTAASMSIKQAFGFYFPTEQGEFCTVQVRAAGGEWKQHNLTNFPPKKDGKNWTDFADNTIDLKDYAGKTIQVAFCYKNDGKQSVAWELQDLSISASK